MFGPAILEEVLVGHQLGPDVADVQGRRVLVAELRQAGVVLAAGLVVLVAWPASVSPPPRTARHVRRAVDDLLPEAPKCDYNNLFPASVKV